MIETPSRRTVLKTGVAISAVGLAGCAGGTSSDDFPSEPIELIIPFAEGGSTDAFSRQIGSAMSDILDIDVQPQNVEGAGSLRGATEAYNAPPDGHTIFSMNPPSTPISQMVHQPDNVDLQEMQGLGVYSYIRQMFIANPNEGIEDLDDLLQRYRDGVYGDIGGQNPGGISDVFYRFLRNTDEYDFQFENLVSYDGGGPIGQAVISGEVPVAGIDNNSAATVGDNFDIIVVFASEGSPQHPDVPTAPDLGFPEIDFIAESAMSMYTQPDTDEEIVQTLEGAIEEAVQSDQVQSWADDANLLAEFGSGAEADEAVDDAFEIIPEQVDLDEVRAGIDEQSA